MTIRSDMIRAAAQAKIHLRDSVSAAAEYLRSHQNADGGFCNRAGISDLYYTVFAIEGLFALGADFDRDRAGRYLRTFDAGDSLDFVHLACLIRAWTDLSDGSLDAPLRDGLLRNLLAYRSEDGGFADAVGADSGTAYGCFLGLAACQDLAHSMTDPARFVASVARLRREDGSFANDIHSADGSTPATAAAMVTLHQLGLGGFEQQIAWLLKRTRAIGGFIATPRAPMQDLLSTATALHALATVRADFEHVKRPCLEFVDSLWEPLGGFCGTWMDDTVDCEYTFYGLLALGNL
ncbi:MAG: terpene cyclase/mutase family protein [Phycisphaerae bacterium]|nr:terpene cyclase/mutase family protein [Phycisphaerae bacterium]